METGQAKLTITLLHLRTEVVGETEGVRLKRVLAVATKRQKYFLLKSSITISQLQISLAKVPPEWRAREVSLDSTLTSGNS